jgi:hypothetical protein
MSRRARARRARLETSARRRLRRRGAPLLVALALAATIGTAFTAGLTGLPPTSAGATSDPWPSFVAGPQTYDTVSTPSTVTFTITPTAGQARARTGGTDWVDCALTANPDEWTCPVTGGTTGFEFVATP